MNRLTKRDLVLTGKYCTLNLRQMPIAQCMKKLQEYENAEEDGLLMWLPCKVGDTVYTIANSRIFLKSVEQISINSRGGWYISKHLPGEWCISNSMLLIPFSDFGKTVFLTREAAERALAKIEEKE